MLDAPEILPCTHDGCGCEDLVPDYDGAFQRVMTFAAALEETID